MRSAPLALAATLVALAPRIAHADALRVATDEGDTWAATIAMLQGDLHGEGRVVHVRVYDDDGDAVPCEEYSLVPDAVTQAAFEIGACDANSGSTALRLVHRAALFDERDVAPRPLMAGISAVQVRTGGASGGARRTGASEVMCSVAVRPYLEDLEHGRRVYLAPGRFVLRPITPGLTASTATDGWTLRSGMRADLSAEFEVIDSQRNEVVVHTRATLSCGAAEGNSAYAPAVVPANATPIAAAAADASCAAFATIDPAGIASSTLHGTSSPTYLLRVDRARNIAFDVSSDFLGDVNVYAGCRADRPRIAVFHTAPSVPSRHAVTLPPGVYTIGIDDHDRARHAGSFTLRALPLESDPVSHLH